MTRSRKLPYFTDQSTVRFGKRMANRRIRRSRHYIKSGNYYKKLYESWDIRDYTFYCPDKDEAYRK